MRDSSPRTFVRALTTICLSFFIVGTPSAAADEWSSDAPAPSEWTLIEKIQRHPIFDRTPPDWELGASHESTIVRAATAYALGRARDPQLFPLVQRLLKDPKTRVRRAAFWSALKFDPALYAEPLCELLSNVSDSEFELYGYTVSLTDELRRSNPASRKKFCLNPKQVNPTLILATSPNSTLFESLEHSTYTTADKFTLKSRFERWAGRPELALDQSIDKAVRADLTSYREDVDSRHSGFFATATRQGLNTDSRRYTPLPMLQDLDYVVTLSVPIPPGIYIMPVDRHRPELFIRLVRAPEQESKISTLLSTLGCGRLLGGTLTGTEAIAAALKELNSIKARVPVDCLKKLTARAVSEDSESLYGLVLHAFEIVNDPKTLPFLMKQPDVGHNSCGVDTGPENTITQIAQAHPEFVRNCIKSDGAIESGLNEAQQRRFFSLCISLMPEGSEAAVTAELRARVEKPISDASSENEPCPLDERERFQALEKLAAADPEYVRSQLEKSTYNADCYTWDAVLKQLFKHDLVRSAQWFWNRRALFVPEDGARNPSYLLRSAGYDTSVVDEFCRIARRENGLATPLGKAIESQYRSDHNGATCGPSAVTTDQEARSFVFSVAYEEDPVKLQSVVDAVDAYRNSGGTSALDNDGAFAGLYAVLRAKLGELDLARALLSRKDVPLEERIPMQLSRLAAKLGDYDLARSYAALRDDRGLDDLEFKEWLKALPDPKKIHVQFKTIDARRSRDPVPTARGFFSVDDKNVVRRHDWDLSSNQSVFDGGLVGVTRVLPIDEHRALILSKDSSATLIDTRRPEPMWKYSTESIDPYETFVSPLAIAVATDSTMHVLDPATGTQRWTAAIEPNTKYGREVTTLMATAGSRLIIPVAGTNSGSVRAVDLMTGKPVWTYANQVALLDVATSGDRAYIISSHGEIIALNALTGAIAWKSTGPMPQYQIPTLWISDPKIGFVTGNRGITAFSKEDGKRLWSWECRLPAPRQCDGVTLSESAVDGESVYALAHSHASVGIQGHTNYSELLRFHRTNGTVELHELIYHGDFGRPDGFSVEDGVPTWRQGVTKMSWRITE